MRGSTRYCVAISTTSTRYQSMGLAPLLGGASPTIYIQVHPTAVVKFHALVLKQLALALCSATGAQANLALRIDHALPGDIVRTGSHGATHPAGAPGGVIAGVHALGRGDEGSNLPVGGDLPFGDLADHLPNLAAILCLIRRREEFHGKIGRAHV